MDRFDAIRAIAGSVLAAYENKQSKTIFTATEASHSSLSDIAFGYSLMVSDDPSLSDNIIGQLDRDTGSISIRCGLSYGKRAFTIAHELGHRALDHPVRLISDGEMDVDETPDYTGLQVQNGIYRSFDDRDVLELEANVFAAELLAPAKLVRDKVMTDPNWTVDGLAEYFGLSRSAMLNQLVAALLPGPIESLDDDSPSETRTPDLNQQAAVEAKTPALVIAGPGAGKTRILVDRFVRLIEEGTPPRRILALTFANKAAEEMRDRLSKALPQHAHEIEVSTFHSFGLNLLKIYGQNIGLKCPLNLLTPLDAFALVKSRLASMPMGGFEDLRQPARNLMSLFGAISRSKDELVDPARFMELSTQWQSELQSASTPTDAEKAEAQENDLQQAGRCIDAAHFFAAYQDLLRAECAVDYGDLIAEPVKLLGQPSVGDEIRNRYDHILVDEFQDINYASGRLLSGLDGGRGIVWVVGDPKQSIYRFRGASPNNLLGFSEDYPGANIIPLDRNYRSVEDIVACGLAVQIPTRSDGRTIDVPKLISHRGRISEDPAVTIITASDAEAELSELVREAMQATKDLRKKDVAVLCRTRAQAQIVSDTLERAGLPTTWTGALQERAVFKDIMGVLYLASDDIRGLIRLSEMSEYYIQDDDLRRLMKWSLRNSSSALAVLYAACDRDIDDLSTECIEQAERLKRLGGALKAQTTVFHSLTDYLFENAMWFRELVCDGKPESRQTLATLGQICGLARAFTNNVAAQGSAFDAACFVEYLESCVEAGELVAPVGEPSDVDAVNVMTIHGSKGLQWPLVFVPFLAERKFPNESRHEQIPIPHGLVRGEDANDNNIEESCLFYVAATRAQNRLVLMRAEKYGRAYRPSIFIEQVLTGLSANGFVETRTADSGAVTILPETATETTTGYLFGNTVRFSALRAYESCPKKFEFQHVLGLQDDDTGYRDFYAVVYAAMKTVADHAAAGNQPSVDHALAALDQEWADRGPIGHWYEQRYRSNAEMLLIDFANRMRTGISVKMRQEMVIDTGTRKVTVIVDEIEENGTIVMRWHRYGKPAKSHENEHMPALMTAIGQQHYPGRDINIKLHYPLIRHEEPVTPSSRVVSNRIKKMADLTAKAESGPYLPKYNPHTCKTCFYSLICPVDIDEKSQA